MRRLLWCVAVALCAVAVVAKPPVIAPSVAWTAGEPLGLHYPSTIDTLFEDYHRGAVPSMQSTAWATTGNSGGAGQNQVFFERPLISDFFMEDVVASWLPSTASQRFYNTRIPMTLLSYTTGGNKYSNQDRTRALFSGNVNKALQLGAMIDYIYSKGSYENQADKNFTWGAFGSYMGDRYELQTFFHSYNYTLKENGGITDDRYITDPAAVQGGDTRVDNKSIPTRLTASQNSLSSNHFYMNHRYKVGYYRTERDSVTDTVIGRTYVPVTSFIWTMDFKSNSHRYINNSGYEDTTFYDHTYLTLGGTDERTRLTRLRNTVGVSLLEGFNRYAKFGFSVYATHEWRRYRQVADTVATRDDRLDDVPCEVPATKSQNLLWIGGQLTKQRGAHLRYAATAQFGLVGDVAGEIDVTGHVETRIPLLGDTASIKAYGYFKNLAPTYLLNRFLSNHYAWENSFGKTQRFRVGGEARLPWSGTRVNVGYETLKNYIYFDTDACPAQHSPAVHVFSVTLDQRLHFKALHWNNRLTYQTSSNDEVLPLPKFSIYSNLYVQFKVARVLGVQLGVDANYYTAYYAPGYNPAIMAFHNQREKKCGDFIFANIYANFKLKRARFFITYTHFDQKLLGSKHYFAIPHYPLNPSRFQLGVSVDFAN